MFKLTLKKFAPLTRLIKGARCILPTLPLTLIFLIIEFYDEFFYAVGYSARPALRNDLGLTYAQIGLLLGLPHLLNIFIEPVLMLLGDTSLRKRLIIMGGLGMTLSTLFIAGAQTFIIVLAAEILSFPCSGSFVTLSQATLMDLNPGRESHMMARWSASGALANLLAPLLIAGGFALALGWRWAYGFVAVFGLILTLIVWPRKFPTQLESQTSTGGGVWNTVRELFHNLWSALRNRSLLRWEALLILSDLLLDTFTGYATLYFADVVGLNTAQTALVLSLMMLAGLISDLVLIRLLEKFNGRTIVRYSAAAVVPLYVAFMLVPGPWAKIILVTAIKLGSLGWWPVLEGETFATIPGRSGTVKAISSLTGLVGGIIIWGIGALAEQAGLATAMWLLLAGPIGLMFFVPKPVTRSA